MMNTQTQLVSFNEMTAAAALASVKNFKSDAEFSHSPIYYPVQYNYQHYPLDQYTYPIMSSSTDEESEQSFNDSIPRSCVTSTPLPCSFSQPGSFPQQTQSSSNADTTFDTANTSLTCSSPVSDFSDAGVDRVHYSAMTIEQVLYEMPVNQLPITQLRSPIALPNFTPVVATTASPPSSPPRVVEAKPPRKTRVTKEDKPIHRRRARLPRSKNGCWTCRCRRKKCDETKPGCQACTNLGIECAGYAATKPEFMKNEASSGRYRAKIAADIKAGKGKVKKP